EALLGAAAGGDRRPVLQLGQLSQQAVDLGTAGREAVGVGQLPAVAGFAERDLLAVRAAEREAVDGGSVEPEQRGVGRPGGKVGGGSAQAQRQQQLGPEQEGEHSDGLLHVYYTSARICW